MSDSPRWTALKPSPAVDAALRRAAAERVMGWESSPSPNGEGWTKRDRNGRAVFSGSHFYPDSKHDNLRDVLRVAWKRWPETRADLKRLWIATLNGSCRAALAALLDLLGIPVPEGLTNE